MIRAKFQCCNVEPTGFGGSKVTLLPIWDYTIPEDERFLKATPSGELTMVIDNPIAVEQLKPGKNFYLDLTETD